MICDCQLFWQKSGKERSFKKGVQTFGWVKEIEKRKGQEGDTRKYCLEFDNGEATTYIHVLC